MVRVIISQSVIIATRKARDIDRLVIRRSPIRLPVYEESPSYRQNPFGLYNRLKSWSDPTLDRNSMELGYIHYIHQLLGSVNASMSYVRKGLSRARKDFANRYVSVSNVHTIL
jgi:hypothetical protein